MFSWIIGRNIGLASTQIAERILDKPHGQDGGRFCAQNARPQAHREKALSLRDPLLLGRESTFRANEQKHPPGPSVMLFGKFVQRPGSLRREKQ
jgi:hypothetical protein